MKFEANLNYEIISIIIQAFVAIGTIGAVIVALWQAKYYNRKKLKLSFSEKTLLIAELLPNNYFSVLKVANIGNKAITIVNWGVAAEKNSHFLVMQNQKDKLLSQVDTLLPKKLEPEEYIPLAIRVETLYKVLRESVDKNKKSKKRKLIIFVADSTGKTYRIKTKRTVGYLLKQLENNPQ